MRHEYTHQPIILLLDGKTSADNNFIKRWFQKSRFSTCEAIDVLEAIEEISDFTNQTRPDVILLECDLVPADFSLIKTMLQNAFGQGETTILAFSETAGLAEHLECFEGNLAQLEAKLNLMLPVYTDTPQALAA